MSQVPELLEVCLESVAALQATVRNEETMFFQTMPASSPRDHFIKNVAINVKGRFTCKKCIQLKDLLLGCRTGSIAERNVYQRYLEHHLKCQTMQRQQYQKRVQDAIQYPKSFPCFTTICPPGAEMSIREKPFPL